MTTVTAPPQSILRFATAGSVDDGKSTLIGRLLYDSKSIFEDQLEAVERHSAQRGHEGVNLALLTDGLRAEREQGITIDVAYRYFATPRRKFIIADTPGHLQYTRNMVTGASTADLAVVLVDARRGLVEQSRRHACIASLLGIRSIVLAVNKMDLVHWDQAVFHRIRDDFRGFATRLEFDDVATIPISALHGDNVVTPSDWMPWHRGPSLLEHLEATDVHRREEAGGARFPVQYVIRDQGDYRGYAGRVAGGELRPGDEVVVAPTGLRSRIAAIDTYQGTVDRAAVGDSVTIRLAGELDVSRGDMIAAVQAAPAPARQLEAIVCWFDPKPLAAGARVLLKHTTRTTKAQVAEIHHRLDVNTLRRTDAEDGLVMNDLGQVSLRLQSPVAVDCYRDNRTTGSFILIDEATNHTVGAGMIDGWA